MQAAYPTGVDPLELRFRDNAFPVYPLHGDDRLIRAEPCHGRGEDRAGNLVFGGAVRPETMMQPCASAAKLRGSGTILWNGVSQVPPRYTATSDHYQCSPVSWTNTDVVSRSLFIWCGVMMPTTSPGAKQRQTEFHRWWYSATTRSAACGPMQRSWFCEFWAERSPCVPSTIGPAHCPSGTSASARPVRSEEHTSELQSHLNLVCRLLLEKKQEVSTPARTARPS